MDAAPPMKLPAPSKSTQCPGRVEVDPTDREVSAATVKAWITHLRSHGWTDRDLDLHWITRARHGVTR